jgi:hypothetical protein
LALLCTLYGKWRVVNDEAAMQVAEGAGGALFAGRVLPTLDAWLDPQCTWRPALSVLINQFIIRQHDRIWLEKGNIESRWLDWNEERIRKEQDYTPGWRSSRHASAVSVMADLDLMKIDEDRKLSVRPQGRRILEEALKLNYGAC